MSLAVAETILTQLGGRKFLAMTGARNLVGGDRDLSLQLPKATCDGIRVTGIRITLDSNDTYTLNAFSVRKLEYRVVKSQANVYCDNLQAVFTSLTGLATHL